MEYVIIGNSVAGIAGAEGIRKQDKQGNITIISDEPYNSYSRPLISYYLADEVDLKKMQYRSQDFYLQNNINCILAKKVKGINCSNNELNLEDSNKINYDKLLIATGGKPIIPPIKGSRKNNIYTFLKLNDAKRISKQINSVKSNKVVILGAGLIGLKVAEALVKKGLEVYVVELAARVLSSILDERSAEIVKDHLQRKGIKFCLQDTITEFIGEENIKGVKLKSGVEINCDLGIIAIGVKPNISPVKDTPIKTNKGILADEHMKTNIDDIYTAGDVCESCDILSGNNNIVPIWPVAYSQGFTAGQNMSGVNKSYKVGFARNSISFFGLSIITAGIINPASNIDHNCEIYQKKSEKSYKKIIVRDNKLIGYILINSGSRAGILTALIKEQLDISEMKDKILDDKFGYLFFSRQFRAKNLYKEVAYDCS